MVKYYSTDVEGKHGFQSAEKILVEHVRVLVLQYRSAVLLVESIWITC